MPGKRQPFGDEGPEHHVGHHADKRKAASVFGQDETSEPETDAEFCLDYHTDSDSGGDGEPGAHDLENLCRLSCLDLNWKVFDDLQQQKLREEVVTAPVPKLGRIYDNRRRAENAKNNKVCNDSSGRQARNDPVSWSCI